MPKLIIIDGPMAVGKSTITARLREKLPSYVYIDRPNLKRGLQPIGSEKAKELSKECAYDLLRKLMKLRVDIIVEEVRLAGVKKAVGELTEGYRIFAYRLQCSVETAIKRDRERSGKIRDDAVRTIHQTASAPIEEKIVDTEIMSVNEIVKLILSEIQKQ